MNDKCIVKSDGLDLSAEEFGSGTPFIFAHGLTSSRAHSRRQLAPLAGSHRVIVFDQRGHAESSPVVDPALYDPQRMAGDIAAVLDAYGVQQAVVGGESTGAATALLFTLQWPERVHALILSDPAFGDQRNAGAEQIKEIGQGILRKGIRQFALDNQQDMLRTGATPEAAAYWSSVVGSHKTESIAMACTAIPEWVILPDLAPLRQLRLPVQIIACEGDVVHPLELAQRMLAELPNARLTTLPSVNVLFDDVELTGRICRDFLAAL
jgi:pimeloyl-ACP methyl ester carboxylesterase